MLRSISFFNFVHYHVPQRLEFEDGTNFIIGGNSTGKTVIFELIRRCLSNRINTTTTSIPNINELAYCVCHYKVIEEEPPNTSDILVCVFVESKDASDHNSQTPKMCHYYKVLYKEKTFFVQQYTGHYDCNTAEIGQPIKSYSFRTEEEIQNITRQETEKTPEQIKKRNFDIHEQIKRLFKAMKSASQQGECNDQQVITKMDKMFEDLDNGFVGLMPMRDSGPLQWTRSERNKHECREKNYQIACDRAEILQALLENSEIDREIEKRYDDILIHPYKFRKTEEGTIDVKTATTWKPLLKISQGIIEAKQLTLLLSHKSFSTITLEEPDKCMHPQMISQLRDFILKRVKNKTVIVISHNPTMIDKYNLQRTYICHRKNIGNESTIEHEVYKVPHNFEQKMNGSIDEMKKILFSPRVLLVEGYTDKIIVEGVFEYIVNSNDDKFDDKFRKYILSIDVAIAHGKDAIPEKTKFCEAFGKPTYKVYDLDAVFKKNKMCGKGDLDLNPVKEFERKEDILMDVEYMERFKKACNKCNTFVWIYGEIEDVILKAKPKLMREIGGNPGKKAVSDKIKQISFADLDQLVEELINISDDIDRFINFLKTKMEEENAFQQCRA